MPWFKHELVRLLNRLVASFHEEMAESIEFPKDVPQFLDESDFNYFPLMSPEETHLDLATLSMDTLYVYV